jgi:hypothetical protein
MSEEKPAEELSILRNARELAERIMQGGIAGGGIAGGGLADSLRHQAEALRAPISHIDPVVLDGERLPDPGVQATQGVQVEVERLAQITAAMSDQIAALVTITSESAKRADRAAWIVIALTVALVALTAVIAWLTWVLLTTGA